MDRDPKEIKIQENAGVIKEELIRNCIRKSLLRYHDRECVRDEGELNLQEVKTLCLSHESIYKIDNLQGFESLLKLQLDNNIIAKIEKLDHLVNLTWLDLSFNNITTIEGLDKLTKLTDLTLFNNQITTVQGLDTLVNLNCLSLGRNFIKSLADIKKLRVFKNLRLLNLQGNPVCNDDNYHNTVYAYLSSLKYLDYELIKEKDVRLATDRMMEDLFDVKKQDKLAEKAEAKRKADEERRQKLQHANLEGMDTLFDDMVNADAERDKIRLLRGYSGILENYRNAFAAIIDKFCTELMTRQNMKDEEEAKYRRVVRQLVVTSERESRAKIAAFDGYRKRMFRQFVEDDCEDVSILAEVKTELGHLVGTLMDLEMMLVEQISSVTVDFESKFKVVVDDNVQKISMAFSKLTEEAKTFNNQMHDVVHGLMEQMHQDDKAFADDTELTTLLQEKDMVNNAVAGSLDNHIFKINSKDDEVREREVDRASKLYRSIQQAEYERNRHRISEIHDLANRYLRSLEIEKKPAESEQ